MIYNKSILSCQKWRIIASNKIQVINPNNKYRIINCNKKISEDIDIQGHQNKNKFE